MSIRRDLLGGMAAVGVGKFAGQGASFLRSVFIARLLGVEDVGVAALFALTVALFTSVTDLATNRLLVQAADGDDEQLQGMVHLFAFAQGLIASVAIFALAGPIARLFDAEWATWAFQTLAALPLITGLRHEDMSRYQRQMRFRPYAMTDATAQLTATLAAIPLAWWLRDYSAMLGVLYVQQITLVIMSHAVAERRYHWSLSRRCARRIVSFGWPLTINSLIMFGFYWGERAIVGAVYSKEELAVYSVSFQLTLLLASALTTIVTSVSLPTLAHVQDDPETLERRYMVLVQGLALFGALLVTPFAIAGGWVVGMIYGQPYTAAGAFVGWLAAAQAMRLVRVAPTIAAMARADTMNSLLANVARTLSTPVALLVALNGAPLAAVAATGLGGELLAITVATHRLWRRQGVPMARTFGPAALVVAFGAVAWGVESLGVGDRRPAINSVLIASVVLSVLLATLALFPGLRSEYRVFVDAARRRAADRRAEL